MSCMVAHRRLDLQKVKGATEVHIEGYTGESVRVFRGGPRDAAAFKRLLARIIQSIVDEAENGETGL